MLSPLKNMVCALLAKTLILPLKAADRARFREVRRIGFIHMGGLGDYLLFSPTMQVLRDEYPDAEMIMITGQNFAGISELFPFVDEFIPLEAGRISLRTLVRILRQSKLDVLIVNHEFEIPSLLLSLAIACSGIPIRIGFSRNKLRKAVLTSTVKSVPRDTGIYLMDIFYLLAENFFRLMDKTGPVDLMSKCRYVPDARSEALLRQVLSSHNPQGATFPIVVIHPGTSRNSKTQNWKKSWPAAHWSAFIHELIRQYPRGRIYLTGGPDDQEEVANIQRELNRLPEPERVRITNLYGQLASVACFAALLASSDVFVGCDSFAMHLAVCVGTPLVAIFGLTNEKRFLPQDGRCQVAARQELACRPCLYITRDQACDDPVCLQVPVKTVLEKTQILLRQASKALSVS